MIETMEKAPDNNAASLRHLTKTADLVAAYVSNNSVRAADLPELIASVHSALATLAGLPTAPAAEPPKEPAVPVKKSITPDFLICLEDGKKFRSLKRHLGTVYNMTPDQYREKWGLPRDYPMVAPAYSAVRSQLAKSIGLGQPGRAATTEAAAPKPADNDAPKKGRGRPKRIVKA